jgi:hypothetical protein
VHNGELADNVILDRSSRAAGARLARGHRIPAGRSDRAASRLLPSLLVPAVVVAALLVLPAASWAGGSVGSPSVLSSKHTARPGHVEAFRSRASASGAVTRLHAYLVRSSTAKRVELGLYRNHGRRPSRRLARCVIAHPRAGAWNACTIKAVHLRAGRPYWNALLRPTRGKGKLRFAAARSGPGRAMRRAAAARKRMPRAWKRGRRLMRWRRASMVADKSGRREPAGFETPPIVDRQLPPSPRPTAKNCFADPSACGYPDADNTGPGGALQAAAGASLPSGASWDSGTHTLRITGNNVTIQNLDIPGSVAVDGDHATIRNSRIHSGDGCSSPCGSYGIRLGQTAATVTGTVLQNLDIVTSEQNPGNDNPLDPATIDTKLDHGVRNNGDNAVTADHLYVKGFAGAWKGPGTITNSYLFSQLIWPGDHVEAYLNGGEGNPTILVHDTILNPVPQTAAISLFNDFGGIGEVTVQDNLLAGGGYVMYGGAKNGSGNVTGPILIKDNRLARGNHDSHGYFPDGGKYGLWAEFNRSATTACGNYWDDTLSLTQSPASTPC